MISSGADACVRSAYTAEYTSCHFSGIGEGGAHPHDMFSQPPGKRPLLSRVSPVHVMLDWSPLLLLFAN